MTVRAALAPSSLLRWIRQIGLRIDDELRRRNGVREYSNDPQCVFRMQPAMARRDATLADGTVMRRGDRLVLIHLWNEQVPEIPPGGPALVWGRKMGRMMGRSLQQLSEFLASNPEFDNALAIRADLALATSRHTAQLVRIMQHLGFEDVPETGSISWKEQIYRLWRKHPGFAVGIGGQPGISTPQHPVARTIDSDDIANSARSTVWLRASHRRARTAKANFTQSLAVTQV